MHLKLAFYYHIPASIKPDGIYFPAYYGVFIDSIASQSEQFILVVHEATEYENEHNNYKLQSKNVNVVNLGITTPAWHRAIFHKNIMSDIKETLNRCDAMIVRCPCALAPFMHNYISKEKIWFLAIGNYREAAKHWKIKSIRDGAIKIYLLINDFLFRRQLRRGNLLVNSKRLLEEYSGIAQRTFQVSTSTISETDFYYREDTCLQKEVNLLYAGRIDRAKGLFELVEAVATLVEMGRNIQLHLAGWELNEGNHIEMELKLLAKKLGIINNIKFLGMLSSGNALNNAYRSADIFVLPSYHEGFPRVIWEAFANSLPVVATKVGGIPDVLIHLKNGLLIPPKKSSAIAEAINQLLENPKLRKNLISEGRVLAKENMVQNQTSLLMNYIKNNTP